MKAYLKTFIAMSFSILGLLFVIFVWPTPYRYDRFDTSRQSLPVRINRFTGKADWLVPSEGWQPMQPDERREPDLTKPLFHMDVGAIRDSLETSGLVWTRFGFISGSVYNPTNYTLMELTFRITVSDKKDQKLVLDRTYQGKVYILPHKVGSVSIDPGYELKPNQQWRLDLLEAKGSPTIAIKTASDFIEWKLHILRDSEFLGLPSEERRKGKRWMIEKLPDHPDFSALPREEKSKVIQFLEKKERDE